MRRLLVCVLLALGVAGCQRGCLRRAVDDLAGGPGGELPQGRGELPRTAACPLDIARCSNRRVRAAGRLPPEVKCSPEGCPCPWDDLGECPLGCVVDGLELDVGRDRALRQLCAPPRESGTASFAMAVPPGSLPAPAGGVAPDGNADEPTAEVPCEIERYRCDRGIVFRCSGARTSVYRCLGDCAEEGGTVLAEVTAEQAAALLCRR